MNYSFLRILNDIKTALLIKKLTITVKYSKQNILFLRYLQIQGFISSIVKKGKIVIICLKYDSQLVPIISGISISSKTSHNRPKRLFDSSISNLTVNLTTSKKKYTQLLARFR